MTFNSVFFGRVRRLHFVGIGGIGMSGIAQIVLRMGFKVQGSDLHANDTTRRLEQLGATIFEGHQAQNVADSDVVVISSDIKKDNSEVQYAVENHIPVIARAEMLAELMRLKYGIAVAGSHGKTTTTSLVSAVLQQGGLDPTVVIGGTVNHIGSNALLGEGPFLVAEADESDGSFQLLSPTIAVVTNLDLEHLDYWKGGLFELKDKFTHFLNRLPFYGLAVLCNDNPNVRDILPLVKRRVVTYGLDNNSDFMAQNLLHEGMMTSFEVTKKDVILGNLKLHLVGRHNAQNALAAVAIGDELGISFENIKAGLENFSGVQRRFSLVGQHNNITFIDDYGHHPTEIVAVLKATRLTFPQRRVVVLFQPHRYSRTHLLLQDFVAAFKEADVLLLTDIYAARESPIEGVDSDNLARAIRESGHPDARYVGDLSQAILATGKELRSGDICITLGAGTVTQAGPKILDSLK